MLRVYLPLDSTALALGADTVANAVIDACQARGIDVDLVRTGSRGMLWLEPMLELETAAGRVAYGPVQSNDVAGLLDAALQGKQHTLALGEVSALPWLQAQSRVTFARVGVIDPLDIDAYEAHGGFAGLRTALAQSAQASIDAVKHSGLRGRGGAAFPTGIKWQTVLDTAQPQKYIVCNADEGDSGTFADRMMMEGDPFTLIEGMTIAGLAVGAQTGYIYLREEYRQAQRILSAAIERATNSGFLGANVCDTSNAFTLHVRLGAGSYICGEETALLESLEGRRGVVRAKPPLPAIQGLFGQPTVVNNVITFASVPSILADGPDTYAAYGRDRSRGTMPFQLAGNLKHTGLVELPFGYTLRTLLEEFGGGSQSGRPLRAVQVGGPLGAYLPASQWDIPLDYEAFTNIGGVLGHGGIVAFDDSVDMLEQARFAMEFCAVESCGKCTPCRIGSVRGVEVIDRIRDGQDRHGNIALLRDLCATMVDGSLCAMGGMTPFPVQSALTHFSEDFGRDQEA